MVINNNYSNRIINSPLNTGKVRTNNVRSANNAPAGVGFENFLQQAIDKNTEVKFSKHAELRMQARNIDLTQTQKDKINNAVSMAQKKGVKDSLVILDDMAFVVNINSKTVITAVNNNELKDNVFTNIDGAIFA
ncbi:flagellar biosynthesis protein [Ruminiclostridium herbifermentans]|uniref:Flagellar biosynthesis protein n=1 Tax=Ruminiclostridium herbifermentans TaxID=2488810 RepID=A0A4U7JJL8_9FIRM|nr:TIGR02530 family flagellar biosynthesis protein [Ruminiclostridium herbifermentans]QNU68392.1 flagellar biosynthesis protein [Ruminiclostridium herbifermentans]